MALTGTHVQDETGRIADDNLRDQAINNYATRLTTAETTLANKQDVSAKGQANGYASLDSGGKVPSGQVPAIAINNVFQVANQAAMLALSASPGDIAFRSDVSTGYYQLTASPASTLGNWVLRTFVGSGVSSINGTLTGAVTGIETITNKGSANGYAPLDANSKIPSANIPSDASVVSHVLEYHPYDFRRYAPANAATNGADCTTALAQALTDLAATTTQGMKYQAASTGAYQGGSAANGGAWAIHVSGGMYYIGNLPNDINCHRATFEGESWGSGFIRMPSTSGNWFKNKRDSTKHVSFLQFRNMTINGNSANQSSSGTAILFQGDTTFTYNDVKDEDFDVHNYVTNCQLIEIKGDAIRCEGSGGDRISFNRMRSINGIGIYMDFDNHAEGNDIGWTDKQSIYMAGDSCGITGGKYWYSGQGFSGGTNGQAIYCSADSGSITGIRTQDTKAQGLLLDGANNVTVSGANIDSASTSSAGSYAGLEVFNSSYCSIMPFNVENRFNGPDSVLDALKIDTNSQNNTIIGTAGKTPWGLTSSLKSGSVKHASTYVMINGTVL